MATPVSLLGDIASTDPVSAILLLAGAVTIGFTMLVAGYLALGAFADAIIPAPTG